MKNKWMSCALSALTLLMIPIAGLADEENESAAQGLVLKPVVQELFMSDLAFTQGRSEFQVSAHGDWHKVESKNFYAAPLSVEYGITDWFQIGAQVPVQVSQDAPEELIGVGAKFKLYRAERIAVAAAVEATFPKEGSDREYEPSAGVTYSLDPVYLNLNAGAEISIHKVKSEESESTETKTQTTPFVSPGLVYVIGHFRPSFEIPMKFGDERATFLAPGITWIPTEGIEAGLGYYTQIAGADDTRVSGAKLNLIWEFDI